MAWELLNSDMPIKKFIKDYFAFSKSERNGIIVLLFLVCLLLLINGLLNYIHKKEVVDFSAFENEIQEFEKQMKVEIPIGQRIYDSWSEEDERIDLPEIFPFDPNSTSREEWQKLGLTDKQINTVFNYLNSGGKFYEREDLKKIYGLSKAQYEALEPYIRIEQSDQYYFTNQRNKEIRGVSEFTVEINSADTVDLMSLWGIGPVFARRITKYRDILGGFITKDQLLEVYGFKQETLKEISRFVYIDTTLINKINLNSTTFQELLRHPYLNKYQVTAILNYRDLKGGFVDLEELTENRLLPADTYLRVKPYLFVE
jgi:competence protein ComEA